MRSLPRKSDCRRRTSGWTASGFALIALLVLVPTSSMGSPSTLTSTSMAPPYAGTSWYVVYVNSTFGCGTTRLNSHIGFDNATGRLALGGFAGASLCRTLKGSHGLTDEHMIVFLPLTAVPTGADRVRAQIGVQVAGAWNMSLGNCTMAASTYSACSRESTFEATARMSLYDSSTGRSYTGNRLWDSGVLGYTNDTTCIRSGCTVDSNAAPLAGSLSLSNGSMLTAQHLLTHGHSWYVIVSFNFVLIAELAAHSATVSGTGASTSATATIIVKSLSIS